MLFRSREIHRKGGFADAAFAGSDRNNVRNSRQGLRGGRRLAVGMHMTHEITFQSGRQIAANIRLYKAFLGVH